MLLITSRLTTKFSSIKFNSLCKFINAQEVADVAEAEQMSHSVQTQQENYSTLDLSERDETHRLWWRYLGATNIENASPVTGEIQPITKDQLQASLEYLLEMPEAQFREGKLESCSHVANSREESALIGLDCGVGKSATYTLPLHSRHMYQKITGVTIVICPHRLAMRQQYEKSVYMFRSTAISVGIFSGNDIDDEFTAESAGKFDLIFMTIDAWSRVVSDKAESFISEMRKSRGIHHIIFDEYHFLYEETGIRLTKYLSTSKLLATGAPISILTATLPGPFRLPVKRFLGIENSSIEIGTSSCKHPNVEFNIYSVTTSDLPDEAARRISARLKSHPNNTVHCIAHWKERSNCISELLYCGWNIDNTVVNGDSADDVLDSVAKDHSAGNIKVLVSTYGAALDGPKVDYVLIAGGAWSTTAIVQYIGRIRSQSQGSSAVVDFLYVDDTPQAHWDNTTTTR